MAEEFNFKSVGIFGAGRSTRGVIDYLRRHSAPFTLTVRSDKPLSPEEYDGLDADIFLLGNMARRNFYEDILFLSPAVKRCALAACGTRLCSDAELFFNSFRGRAIGVTGSDGKSTVTYLISAVLEEAGIPSLPAGNFGRALCDLIDRDDLMPVCELSSFQLADIEPELYRAVITNITENHLDWHSSFEEYAEAKLNITRRAGEIVFDADCEAVCQRLGGIRPFAITSAKLPYPALKDRFPAENYITYSGDTVFLNGEALFSTDAFIRKEEYNIRNYMLAVGATLGLADRDTVYGVLKEFGGLAHRAQLILSSGGIDYIDSSIDSSPARSARTLSSLGRGSAVIIGGRGKGLSQAPLLDVLYRTAVGAVLMGDSGRELYDAAMKDSRYDDFEFKFADTMAEAVEAASGMPGALRVVLSPAATSFDKYKNYEKRGDDFITAAKLFTKENKI